LPRRKPDGKSVIVNRIEVGDFERKQLEDAKMALVVAAVTPAVGLAALGVGIAAAGMLIGNTLSDIKDFWDEGKEKMWGLGHSDEVISQSTTNAPADLNNRQLPVIDELEFPGVPDLEGMSPAAIYELLYGMRGDIQDYSRDLWLTTNNLESRPYNRILFSDGCTGLLRSRPFADPRIFDGDEVSNFTYQMAIRETAARRNQGRATSTVAGLLTGWGVIASEAVWRIGNFLGIGQASEWTSGNVTEAPGYIADPILDWVRTIVDFPGTDASHFGTYEYSGLFTDNSTTTYNIASRAFVEDIMKIHSSIENTINITRLQQFLSGMFPNPP